MADQGPRTGNQKEAGNRFAMRVGRQPYANKSEYLKALSSKLTPDVWDMIVTRAIHDATVGRTHDRTKARDWLARYILPTQEDIEFHSRVRRDHDFLQQIYQIFDGRIRNNEDIEDALAKTFAVLKPDELATLRNVFLKVESGDPTKFWDEVRARNEEKRKQAEST